MGTGADCVLGKSARCVIGSMLSMLLVEVLGAGANGGGGGGANSVVVAVVGCGVHGAGGTSGGTCGIVVMVAGTVVVGVVVVVGVAHLSCQVIKAKPSCRQPGGGYQLLLRHVMDTGACYAMS